MKTREPHMNTFIQGLNSEHYQPKTLITGTWNNAGDDFFGKDAQAASAHRANQNTEKRGFWAWAFRFGGFGILVDMSFAKEVHEKMSVIDVGQHIKSAAAIIIYRGLGRGILNSSITRNLL